jgi:hypothetical protein
MIPNLTIPYLPYLFRIKEPKLRIQEYLHDPKLNLYRMLKIKGLKLKLKYNRVELR